MKRSFTIFLLALCSVFATYARYEVGIYDGYLGTSEDGACVYNFYNDSDLGKIATIAGTSQAFDGALVINEPEVQYENEMYKIYAIENNAFSDLSIEDGTGCMLDFSRSHIVEVGSQNWKGIPYQPIMIVYPSTVKEFAASSYFGCFDIQIPTLFPPKGLFDFTIEESYNDPSSLTFRVPDGASSAYISVLQADEDKLPYVKIEGTPTFTVGDFAYACAYDGEEECMKVVGYTGSSTDLTLPAQVTLESGETFPVRFLGTGAITEQTPISTLTVGSHIAGIEEQAFRGHTPARLVIEKASRAIEIHPFLSDKPFEKVEIDRDWYWAESDNYDLLITEEYYPQLDVRCKALMDHYYEERIAYTAPSNPVISMDFSMIADNYCGFLIPSEYTEGPVYFYRNSDGKEVRFSKGVNSSLDCEDRLFKKADFTSTVGIKNLIVGENVTEVPTTSLTACNLVEFKSKKGLTLPLSVCLPLVTVADDLYTQQYLQDLTLETSNIGLFMPASAVDAENISVFKEDGNWYCAYNDRCAALLKTSDNNIISRVMHDGKLYSVTAIGAEVFKSKDFDMDLPSQIEYIGTNAFLQSSVSSITVPENAKYIGLGAFGLSELKSISLPTTLLVLGDQAFYATKITSLELPINIDVVARGLCADNKYLESVVMLTRVTSIDEQAFASCPALKSISLYTDVPPAATSGVFDTATYSGATLIVPQDHVKDYESADPWYRFNNIRGIDLSEIEIPGAGISDVIADSDAKAEYYTVSGLKVDPENLLPGLYIKRQGATSTKIYVK